MVRNPIDFKECQNIFSWWSGCLNLVGFFTYIVLCGVGDRDGTALQFVIFHIVISYFGYGEIRKWSRTLLNLEELGSGFLGDPDLLKWPFFCYLWTLFMEKNLYVKFFIFFLDPDLFWKYHTHTHTHTYVYTYLYSTLCFYILHLWNGKCLWL